MPRPSPPAPPQTRTSGRGTVLLFAAPLLLGGCSGLTQGEASALATAYDAACPELAIVPVIGGLLAGACVGEEGAVKAALDHAVTATSPAAGPPPPTSAPATLGPGGKLGATLTAMRRGKRVAVGRAPSSFTAAQVKLAQAHLDAQGAR